MATKDTGGGQQKATRSTEGTEEQAQDAQASEDFQERQEKLSEDVDDVLDEIDDVLEANAEDFVRSFRRQTGGRVRGARALGAGRPGRAEREVPEGTRCRDVGGDARECFALGGRCIHRGRHLKRQTAAPRHVDHCHQTGRVRGVLCFNCNSAIGKLGDDPDTLRRAIAYLEGNAWKPTLVAPGVYQLPS